MLLFQVTFEGFKANFVEILCQSTIERVAGEDDNSNSQDVSEITDETGDETDVDGDEEVEEDEIVEERIIDEDKYQFGKEDILSFEYFL